MNVDLSELDDISPQDFAKAVAKELHELQVQQTKKKVDDLFQFQAKLTNQTFAAAKGYQNVMIASGYAVFFGMWALLKDRLVGDLIVWAAFSIALSAILFVGWEIVQQLWTTFHLRRSVGILKVAEGEDLLEKIQEFQKKDERERLWLIRAWAFFFVPSLLFGLAGIGLMFWKMLEYIASHFPPA